MLKALFKLIGWLPMTVTEMRAAQLRDAQRELVDAEQMSERYSHTVVMLKARIKRLSK